MKIVVGLVGEKGSGKETFGNFLMEIAKDLPAGRQGRKVIRVRFSDLLNETLKLWSLLATRENLQNLAIIMDKEFGDGTLTQAIFQRIQALDGDLIILDGVRWESDEKLIRSFPKNFLIYITASKDLRFERLKKRQEKVDEAKTFAQFMKEEQSKTETLISKIGQKADFKLENNSGFEELKKQTEKIYNSIN